MFEKEQAKFNVIGQYLRDLSFENLISREVQPQGEEPMINVNADVNYSEISFVQENTYEVALSLSATMSIGEKKLFIAEVKFVGVVQFDQAYSEEQIEPVLYIEVPYYLYFETRNIVASLAFQSGFGPIFLRPVDFSSIYLSKSKHAEKFQESLNQQ